METFIGRRLKKFSNRYQAPANGRARLLQAVAQPESRQGLADWFNNSFRSPRQYYDSKRMTSSTWSIGSFDWSTIYSLHFNYINVHVLL